MRLWFSVLLALVALPASAPADEVVDLAFVPKILADRLSALPMASYANFPAPFGAPEEPRQKSVTYEDAEIGTIEEVSIAMPAEEARYNLVYYVFASEAAAKKGFDKALLIPEALGDDDIYHVNLKTVGVIDAARFPGGFEMTCATKRLDEPISVTQVYCAYPAPDGQSVVAVERYRRDAPVLSDLEAITDVAFSLADPLVKGLEILADVEQALLEEGGPGVMPKGGWVFAPARMAQKLMAADFAAGETYQAPFGRPGPAVSEDAAVKQRAAGLFGKVRIPMNGAGLESGLEYWIYDSTAQARDEEAAKQMMAPPEIFDGGSTGTFSHFATTITRSDANAAVTLAGVRCARRADRPGVVARQIRCLYLRPDSQAAMVAYSYGSRIVDQETWNTLSYAATDVLFTALARLQAAEVALRSEPEAPPEPPALAKLDPALIGTWETYVPYGQAWLRWTLEIAGDATYTFRQEGAFGHRGSFTAKSGQWNLRSQTNDWYDGGTYQMPDAATFNIVGRLGPSSWRRAVQ